MVLFKCVPDEFFLLEQKIPNRELSILFFNWVSIWALYGTQTLCNVYGGPCFSTLGEMGFWQF